jgi:hypothetical protein
LPGKIPGGAATTLSTAKKAVEDPAGAAADMVLGVISKPIAAADSKKRLNKQLNQAHKTERVPTQPKYRVSLFHGGIIIAVCAAFDVINYIAGWFVLALGAGEAVVVIIDPIFAALLAAYCRFVLKLPVGSHIPIYTSVLGFWLIGNIPFVNALWWADGWYIVHVLRSEDRATHKQLLATIEEERQQEERENWIRNYEEQKAVEAQQQDDADADDDQILNNISVLNGGAKEQENTADSQKPGRMRPIKPDIPQKTFSSTNASQAGRMAPTSGIIK